MDSVTRTGGTLSAASAASVSSGTTGKSSGVGTPVVQQTKTVFVAVKVIRKGKMYRKVAEEEVKLYKRFSVDGPRLDPVGYRYVMTLFNNESFDVKNDKTGHLAMVFPLMKCDLRDAFKRYGGNKGASGFPLSTVARYEIF